MISRLYRWIDERYQIENLIEFSKKKHVPVHNEFLWYYFGGVTLFLFIVQVISGILLMIYYKPGVETSYESIQFILSEVKFGWLVRSIHSWSANLMILSIFIHMFSVFFTHTYKKPREFSWLGGMVLLLLAFAFGFSGYLLPWNELSFFATKVGTDIMGVIPVVGKPMLGLMRGGTDVTDATLHRFFGIHVAILPGITTVLLGIHLLFVQRQGMSAPDEWEKGDPSKRRTMPFFPNFLLRDLLLWLLVLNLLAILSVVAPFGIHPLEWPLGDKADAFAPAPEGIKPEWYFMFMFHTLRLIPAHIGPFEGELVGILGFGLAGLLWVLIPFWCPPPPDGSMRPWVRAIGLFVLFFIIGMTIWGYLS